MSFSFSQFDDNSVIKGRESAILDFIASIWLLRTTKARSSFSSAERSEE
jgi:hypothetical protein